MIDSTPENGLVTVVPPETKVITACGTARGGKGTTAEAIDVHVTASGLSVVTIDQGQKFRITGSLAEAEGVTTDLDQLTSFLQAPSTREGLLAQINYVGSLSRDDRKELLYTKNVTDLATLIGGVPTSHALMTGIMRDEVESAATNGVGLVILDGRSLEKYAESMERDGVASYILGLYLTCSDEDASRRDGKMTAEEIAERNRNDANRLVDPLCAPEVTFNFDYYRHGSLGVESATAYRDRAVDAQLISFNTSQTANEAEMVRPILDMVDTAIGRHQTQRDYCAKAITEMSALMAGGAEVHDAGQGVYMVARATGEGSRRQG